MSLIKARSDSNAAKAGGETGPTSGEVFTVGFSKVDYPSERPAKSNADVGSTGAPAGDMGNDGTNLDAYKFQPDTIDGKSVKDSQATEGQEK